MPARHLRRARGSRHMASTNFSDNGSVNRAQLTSSWLLTCQNPSIVTFYGSPSPSVLIECMVGAKADSGFFDQHSNCTFQLRKQKIEISREESKMKLAPRIFLFTILAGGGLFAMTIRSGSAKVRDFAAPAERN